MTQYTERKSWLGELLEPATESARCNIKIVLRLEIKATAIIPFKTGK